MTPAKAFAIAAREAARKHPDATPEELREITEDLLHEWRAEIALDRALQDDTPCVESCDDWGPGEGRYHGRIG